MDSLGSKGSHYNHTGCFQTCSSEASLPNTTLYHQSTVEWRRRGKRESIGLSEDLCTQQLFVCIVKLLIDNQQPVSSQFHINNRILRKSCIISFHTFSQHFAEVIWPSIISDMTKHGTPFLTTGLARGKGGHMKYPDDKGEVCLMKAEANNSVYNTTKRGRRPAGVTQSSITNKEFE